MIVVKGVLQGLIEEYKHLTNVEADIIRYLVWRVIIREGEWFEHGLKELACCVKRHKKSIGRAINSLEKKGMIRTKKEEKMLWIKHTLTNDELNTRIAFIDPIFCNAQSIQELQSDLLSEIERFENEITVTNEINIRKQRKEIVIDTILDQVLESAIDELVKNFDVLTYANCNKSLEERIEDALQTFRVEVFGKQEETFEEERETFDGLTQDIYDEYLSSKPEERKKE